MQFETVFTIVIALAVLVFTLARRHIIKELKTENESLRVKFEKIRDVCVRQQEEIGKLIEAQAAEQRARQMATLAAVGSQRPAPRPPITKPPEWKDPDLARDPYKNTQGASRSSIARKQEEATRADSGNTWSAPVNSWDDHNFSAPTPTPAPAYRGAGGSFDGGGASGDYGRSDSGSSSSSSSSDSGSSSSSSSSDSGSSSSSSD